MEQRLLLYDGVCGLCNRWIHLLIRMDRRERLLYAPLEGTTALPIRRRHSSLAGVDSLVYVDGLGSDHETVFVRSEAVLRSLAALGGGWRAASLLRVVPRPVRDGLYDWIARHRYAWFGRDSQCRVPVPDLSRRFLD